jgi:predicted ABC-type sugar transport system permease subunit
VVDSQKVIRMRKKGLILVLIVALCLGLGGVVSAANFDANSVSRGLGCGQEGHFGNILTTPSSSSGSSSSTGAIENTLNGAPISIGISTNVNPYTSSSSWSTASVFAPVNVEQRTFVADSNNNVNSNLQNVEVNIKT